MTRRQLLSLLGLVALVLTSGCAGFFGSQPISDDQLDEEPPAPYVWDNDVNAHITITENARFQAVYRMDRTRMELFRRDGLGGRNAIPVSAVRYRYPNGTVIAGTEFVARGNINPRGHEVTVDGDRRIIRWDSVATESVSVQFYLQRDLLIFGGAAVGLTIVGAAGALYYKRRIDELRRRREELGLDVDTEDDEFRDDPPPGMG